MLFKITSCSYDKRGNKTIQIVLQHSCRMSWKAMLSILPPRNQIWINCNKPTGSCRLSEKLWQTVETVLLFAIKSEHVGCTHATFFNYSKWCNSHVWSDFHIILSNQKSVFTQLATTWFKAGALWWWGGKSKESLQIHLWNLNICI